MKISYKISALSKNFAVLKEIKSDFEIFRATGFKQWYVIFMPEEGDT
jgi:hypothetical protein